MRKFLVIAMVGIICTGCSSLPRRQYAAYRSHLLKGERYLNASKYEEAVKEFTKALEIGKETGKAMLPGVMLGETHLRKGDFVSAKVSAQDIIAKWPDESTGWELLGKINLKANSLKEAEDNFQEALAKSTKEDRERIGSFLALSQGLNSYSQGDVQTAQKFWVKIKDEKLAKEVIAKAQKILEVEVKE